MQIIIAFILGWLNRRKESSRFLEDLEDYFMLHAHINSLRCKNYLNRRGACLVDKKNNIVSNGYSGKPYLHGKKQKNQETEYGEIGAVENGLYYVTRPLENGCRLFLTHFPSEEEIAKATSNNVVEIVYSNEGGPDVEAIEALKEKYGKLLRKKQFKFDATRNTSRSFEIRVESDTLDISGIDVTVDEGEEKATDVANDDVSKRAKASRELEEESCFLTTREDYYMAHTHVNSLRSGNYRTRKGACLVDKQIKIVGNGCDQITISKEGTTTGAGAIENCFYDRNKPMEEGFTLFLTYVPSIEEIDRIITNNVAKVYCNGGAEEIEELNRIYDGVLAFERGTFGMKVERISAKVFVLSVESDDLVIAEDADMK